MTETVVLPDDLAEKLRARVESGASRDAVEVIRSGIAALEAADAAEIELIRTKVESALADPRPSAPAEDVFDRIGALLKSSRHG
jgi:antitoxin ParD1/3/4